MKILYYNWVDYLDDEGRGGGVTVYQRNLMQALESVDWAEPIFLSSGMSYDLGANAPRWERVHHGPKADRARRFEIVNSGVKSPAHHSFGDPAQVNEPATQAAFFDFIERTGPYDVVHFNNLEGLPATVLGLKARWPDTRVVLSLHNYYPICPQVNLWYQERVTCVDFAGGRNCVNCLEERHNPKVVRLSGALTYRLQRAGIRPGMWLYDTGFRWTMRQGWRVLGGLRRLIKGRAGGQDAPAVTAPSQDDGAGFAARRNTMLDLINTHCDRVLCMSDAVRAVALSYGIAPGLAHTSYIGTIQAESWARTTPRPSILADDGTLTLCFMGYMRRDKGFFFLLDALEAMPDAVVARLRLVIAARRGDGATMARIAALTPRLAGVEHIDGYRADDLDRLLGQVDLGVIPVLWHDNLPQVALEMHARHIPLLTADMGGAQELGNTPDMVFRAGDIADFTAKITAVLDGGFSADAYWQNAMAPLGMQTHIDELERHYSSP